MTLAYPMPALGIEGLQPSDPSASAPLQGPE